MVSVSCFGVRVSVMFHFMYIYYTFSSVWVAEWPPFGNSCLLGEQFVLIVFCLFVIFIYFPFWFKERDLPFDCSSSCSLLFYYFLRYGRIPSSSASCRHAQGFQANWKAYRQDGAFTYEATRRHHLGRGYISPKEDQETTAQEDSQHRV